LKIEVSRKQSNLREVENSHFCVIFVAKTEDKPSKGNKFINEF